MNTWGSAPGHALRRRARVTKRSRSSMLGCQPGVSAEVRRHALGIGDRRLDADAVDERGAELQEQRRPVRIGAHHHVHVGARVPGDVLAITVGLGQQRPSRRCDGADRGVVRVARRRPVADGLGEPVGIETVADARIHVVDASSENGQPRCTAARAEVRRRNGHPASSAAEEGPSASCGSISDSRWSW